MAAKEKTGLQTTEFWLTLAAMLAATVMLGVERITAEAWSAVMVGAPGTYSIARAVTKSKS